MNKSLVTAALLLPCFLAYSQVSDELGSGAAELSVIARAEYLSSDPLGNTSLYTFLEGSFSEHFSYSISNHWLSSVPEDLYSGTFHSDNVNWLDWSYLTYSSGNWGVNLGKMPVLWGTYEFDEYDYNIHFPFASSVWNSMNAYQWGISASYVFDEYRTLEAAFTTSPFGERFFTSGLYVFGLRAIREKGPVSCRLAYNLFGTGEGKDLGSFSAGLKVDASEALSFTLDTQNVVGSEEVLTEGKAVALSVDYSPAEKVGTRLYTDFEFNEGADMKTGTVGLSASFSLKENIRFHALCAYKYGNVPMDPAWQFSVGVICSFGRKW